MNQFLASCNDIDELNAACKNVAQFFVDETANIVSLSRKFVLNEKTNNFLEEIAKMVRIQKNAFPMNISAYVENNGAHLTILSQGVIPQIIKPKIEEMVKREIPTEVSGNSDSDFQYLKKSSQSYNSLKVNSITQNALVVDFPFNITKIPYQNHEI